MLTYINKIFFFFFLTKVTVVLRLWRVETINKIHFYLKQPYEQLETYF